MQLGVIGLGTMGAALARNAARNGAEVVVFNRTPEKTDAFLSMYGTEGTLYGVRSLAELSKKLSAPRAILLMVKAGDPVLQIFEELVPLLSEGDIIIDGGNSHDIDTMARSRKLERERGIHLLGMGVSGGEEGALRGPSMMLGGSKETFDILEPLLRKMAADDSAGGKCVAYIGPEGSGHFVKMVHNGIEYGMMQLIAEAFDLLQHETTLTNEQMADLFEEWNRGDTLSSFLVEITAAILRKKDPETGKFLLDVIKDAAGQKGTGQWTTSAAMHDGVSVPTITAAVDARIISSGKDFRMKQSKEQVLAVHPKRKIPDLIMLIQTALELSVLNAYAQGFQLLEAYGRSHEFALNLSEIARIWRGGCIIRSRILEKFQRMFAGDKNAALFVRGKFTPDAQKHWRSIVALGALRGIPLPAMSASLSYFDAYRTEKLPQNLIQAQRDFFGAHGFERIDKPGIFHGTWMDR